MKVKNPYIALLAVVMLSIGIYSCRKEFVNTPKIQPEAQWAKQYFNDVLLADVGNKVSYTITNKVSSTVNAPSKPNLKTPIWARATTDKTNLFDYVEVPLMYTRKITSIIGKKDQKLDMEIIKASFDRLIIFKDKNGKIDQRIISFIPDKDYLIRHKGDISHNKINKLDSDFNGYLIYKTWDDKIVNRLRIVNRKAVSLSKNSQSNYKLNKLATIDRAVSDRPGYEGEPGCEDYYLVIWETACYFTGDNPFPDYCDEPVIISATYDFTVCPDDDPSGGTDCLDPVNFSNPECLVVDCAGVPNGAAVTECGYCIGGTTGVSSLSQLGDSPSTVATASISKVSPSAASISALGSSWGLCDVETVDLTIGASLDNCVWTAVLISVKGNYSLQARLLPGCTEVGGNTTSSNYCDQIYGLKSLGGGNQWYMLSAVIAHENVHASRLGPGLNDALASIEADVKTLTVPATGQTKAQAISQLRALAGFEAARTDAKGHWDSKYVALIVSDHYGPTDMAEHAVVDPIGISICNLKNSNPSWPGCSYCPY